MNNLNSILIEGLVVDRDDKVNKGRFSFVISSKRYNKVTASVHEEASIKEVVTKIRSVTSGSLAESCAEYLLHGRVVRIVGHLEHAPAGEIIIIADHVEFKPIFDKK